MLGEVKIITPGIYSTIQDIGRKGYRSLGIPNSGAMDHKSHLLANTLLGNINNEATLEWTIKGPELYFNSPTYIALTGAKTKAKLNGELIPSFQKIYVPRNSTLEIGYASEKVYGYIAIHKGFLVDEILGSKSFSKAITTYSFLQKNVKIQYNTNEEFKNNFSKVRIKNSQVNNEIKCFKGPEFDKLSSMQKDILLNTKFTISEIRSRMGIQLVELLFNDLNEMITSPVLPGTVQLTSSGKMILLMRDCQTTGGYPRILTIRKESLDDVAQLSIGAKCSFHLL